MLGRNCDRTPFESGIKLKAGCRINRNPHFCSDAKCSGSFTLAPPGALIANAGLPVKLNSGLSAATIKHGLHSSDLL